MFGRFDSINVVWREPWKFQIMSFVYALIFLLTLGGACFGSWKAALHWTNRTRDARHEDPRDQEIRELSAALSIARKNLEKLDNRSGSSAHELAVLQDQVNVTAAALAETQEKIRAANEAVSREIETREALDARLAQMRRDLDAAKSRVAELEVQVKIVSPSSGLVAGLDDVLEDDEKEVFTIRHEHKIFKQQVAELEEAMTAEKAESTRWKQHCNVLGTTNKALRQRANELGEQLKDLDDLRVKAAQLITATADNETLRMEADELRKVAAEVLLLKSRIIELEAVQHQNLLLQDQIAKLVDVHEANAQLTRQLADFVATQAQLLAAQQDNQQLQTQLAELARVEQDNVNLRAHIDALAAIETDNETLRSNILQLQSKHSEELNNVRQENDKLQVRVAAIDQIQEENAQLLLQSRELRHTQAKVSELQTQLTEMERVKIASAALEAQLTELRATLAQIEEDRNSSNQQLLEAHGLHSAMSAQAAELRLAHDSLQAKLIETAKNASAVEKSLGSTAQKDSDNTDSLPVLSVTEAQDDLQSIRGVGAKLEQKLNMIGICNFRDLIELEARDYERAAQLIPDLENRSQRDNWRQQARNLHRHKYEETI